jgi:hypothetical protein
MKSKKLYDKQQEDDMVGKWRSDVIWPEGVDDLPGYSNN